MDVDALPDAMSAGCTRAVVVRAVTEADDPASAAAAIAKILAG
jgi:thiamine-phosphate pyrophosphorylase